jgi:hypothetical protein
MIEHGDQQSEGETFVDFEALIHIILDLAFASRVRESFNVSYCQILKVSDVGWSRALFFFPDCVS